MMDDIKVRAYGFFAVTRNTYIVLQTVAIFFILIGILCAVLFDLSNHSNIMIRNLGLIGVVILVGELLETYFMLKKFKQKNTDRN